MSQCNRNQIAVLIANSCSQRLELLEHRSLESVKKQTLCPDVVVLILDYEIDETIKGKIELIKERVWSGEKHRPDFILISNRRTKKTASGTWNSGLDELCRRYGSNAEGLFVAVLDDDDAWTPDHLELCSDAACEKKSDMVISGLIRHDNDGDTGRAQTIPDKLEPEKLFVKNTHIQGSNLFVKLSRFLEVGGFDENLTSCTDRDICIRFSRLDSFTTVSLQVHTVHHYADCRLDRLTLNRDTKGQGLRNFYDKHAPDFHINLHHDFFAICQQRFGISESFIKSKDTFCSEKKVTTSELTAKSSEDGLYFVIGVTTDSAIPQHAINLFKEIRQLTKHEGVLGVSVVLLENGPEDQLYRKYWLNLIEEMNKEGIKLKWIQPDEVMREWAPQQAVTIPDARLSRLPIAITRSILNYYVHTECKSKPGSVAWILDDDKTFTFEVRSNDGSNGLNYRSPNVAQLLTLKSNGVDVVIGQDSAAAPLPFEATLRLQLLDIEQGLRRLVSKFSNSNYCDVIPKQIAGYYDLSRETKYLETPLSLDLFDNSSLEDTIKELTRVCQRIRAGESITRPLMIDEDNLDLGAAQDSIMRGGSTIFFKPEQLMLFPQYSTRVGDTWVRRSDMLHSLILSKLYGVKIVMHASAAVRHNRENLRPIENLSDTLTHDILGYGLYRGAQAAFDNIDESSRIGICNFFYKEKNINRAEQIARKSIRERLAVTQLSAWRVSGLVGCCNQQLSILERNKIISPDVISDLRLEFNKIRELFLPSKVISLSKKILTQVNETNNLLCAYRNLEIETISMQLSFKANRTELLCSQRIARARSILNLGDDAELLGVGWEGVVFRSGETAIKLLDIIKPARVSESMPALKILEQLEDNTLSFSKINIKKTDEGLFIITRPYIKSEGVSPPSLGLLYKVLDDCKKIGIVFRNLSPANIVYLPNRVLVIDYGWDFRLFNQDDYDSMSRKAWICARFWNRSDINELLTMSLKGHNTPEFDGYLEFDKWYHSEKKSATVTVTGLVEELLKDYNYSSLLDYGCGKQAYSVQNFYSQGKVIVGYDPGEGIDKRWADRIKLKDGMFLTSSIDQALIKAPFDVVICSLVLCELQSDSDLMQAVLNISKSVRKDGKVIIVICDPLNITGSPTAIHRQRKLPTNHSYSNKFIYDEIAETGLNRREFHRSVRELKRVLAINGLHVCREISNKTFDTLIGLPATDFIAWECNRYALQNQTATTSLVIKASALEGESIIAQVQHLVEQLEHPRPFLERILAIDSKISGFAREYGLPDLSKTLEAAEFLKSTGYIDKIVLAPLDDSSQTIEINKRWFGIKSAKAHSVKGAPIVSPLAAFEQCSGDYILQLDADLLIRREDRLFDYIGEAIQAMNSVPNTLTVSLNILNDKDHDYRTHNELGSPFRVECRGCLFNRKALMDMRPLPNAITSEGYLELAWHRSMDEKIKQSNIRSLRGGSKTIGFVHPENSFKRSFDELNVVMSGIEQGVTFKKQIGNVNLVGGSFQWLPEPRNESYIFVVTGRNVSYGKMIRCYESMARQSGCEWGAVVIDDGSDELSREACRRVFGYASNITLLQPRRRRGQLANTVLAIRRLCKNPNTVIITLDMDDALIGNDVLLTLKREYETGADLTVGSMVRTDKDAKYPATFSDLHTSRGGSVWQHLRSFHKKLFDGIPDWRLRIDGSYVTICVDWAFMIPIAEQSKSPRYIPDKLYFYESSGLGKADQKLEREVNISRIMKRHRPGGFCQKSTDLITMEEIMGKDWRLSNGLLILRHADRPKGQSEGHVDITDEGRKKSYALGKSIGNATAVVSSTIKRTNQTAEEIMSAIGHDFDSLRQFDSLRRLRADEANYPGHKTRLKWGPLVDSWIDGALNDPEAVVPSHKSALDGLRELMSPEGIKQQGLTIVISHDFYIHALLEAMIGRRNWNGKGIPFLGGVYIDYSDARYLINAYDS